MACQCAQCAKGAVKTVIGRTLLRRSRPFLYKTNLGKVYLSYLLPALIRLFRKWWKYRCFLRQHNRIEQKYNLSAARETEVKPLSIQQKMSSYGNQQIMFYRTGWLRLKKSFECFYQTPWTQTSFGLHRIFVEVSRNIESRH